MENKENVNSLEKVDSSMETSATVDSNALDESVKEDAKSVTSNNEEAKSASTEVTENRSEAPQLSGQAALNVAAPPAGDNVAATTGQEKKTVDSTSPVMPYSSATVATIDKLISNLDDKNATELRNNVSAGSDSTSSATTTTTTTAAAPTLTAATADNAKNIPSSDPAAPIASLASVPVKKILDNVDSVNAPAATSATASGMNPRTRTDEMHDSIPGVATSLLLQPLPTSAHLVQSSQQQQQQPVLASHPQGSAAVQHPLQSLPPLSSPSLHHSAPLSQTRQSDFLPQTSHLSPAPQTLPIVEQQQLHQQQKLLSPQQQQLPALHQPHKLQMDTSPMSLSNMPGLASSQLSHTQQSHVPSFQSLVQNQLLPLQPSSGGTTQVVMPASQSMSPASAAVPTSGQVSGLTHLQQSHTNSPSLLSQPQSHVSSSIPTTTSATTTSMPPHSNTASATTPSSMLGQLSSIQPHFSLESSQLSHSIGPSSLSRKVDHHPQQQQPPQKFVPVADFRDEDDDMLEVKY